MASTHMNDAFNLEIGLLLVLLVVLLVLFAWATRRLYHALHYTYHVLAPLVAPAEGRSRGGAPLLRGAVEGRVAPAHRESAVDSAGFGQLRNRCM